MSIDARIVSWFVGERTEFLDNLFWLITEMGDVVFLLAIVIAATVLARYGFSKDRMQSLWIALVGSSVSMYVLKNLFDRPRPMLENALTEVTASFPSGHATVSSAVYGLMAWWLWKSGTKHGRWIAGILILLILAIGISRIYLGKHYPTDILAGWILGAAWIYLLRK